MDEERNPDVTRRMWRRPRSEAPLRLIVWDEDEERDVLVTGKVLRVSRDRLDVRVDDQGICGFVFVDVRAEEVATDFFTSGRRHSRIANVNELRLVIEALRSDSWRRQKGKG